MGVYSKAKNALGGKWLADLSIILNLICIILFIILFVLITSSPIHATWKSYFDTFNVLVTPLASIAAAIIYFVTLKQIRIQAEQAKVQGYNQTYLLYMAYFNSKIDKLYVDGNKVIDNLKEFKKKKKTVTLLNFLRWYYQNALVLTNDDDYLATVQEFKKGKAANIFDVEKKDWYKTSNQMRYLIINLEKFFIKVLSILNEIEELPEEFASKAIKSIMVNSIEARLLEELEQYNNIFMSEQESEFYDPFIPFPLKGQGNMIGFMKAREFPTRKLLAMKLASLKSVYSTNGQNLDVAESLVS